MNSLSILTALLANPLLVSIVAEVGGTEEKKKKEEEMEVEEVESKLLHSTAHACLAASAAVRLADEPNARNSEVLAPRKPADNKVAIAHVLTASTV